ncbi:LOW QUALITY PROTEIN: Serine/threonine protein kinase [Phytophthora megakarya]|uniref:Serine/threonine protein kinase n=1 Tax=Phytophthora megakarya TaxID=4795 RepID=A0A225VCC8_9STRA|nr:LOW QUALITY PROTEIN: Serine/threonine protein kinase [Phytophthora megakarya]
MIVLDTIQGAIEQQNSCSNPIRCLSSSSTIDFSIDFFLKQLRCLLVLVEAPAHVYNEMAQRWSYLRKRMTYMFVAKIDNTLPSLHSTETKDLLNLLHRELQNSSYSTAEFRKKYDEVCSMNLESIIEPRLSGLLGDLEDAAVFAHGGYSEVSRAKYGKLKCHRKRSAHEG